jgi:ribulose-5-phosphate 4-epimerase/fuculose-1-phosphate aldolase
VTDLRPVSARVDEAAFPRTFARSELHSSPALRRFVDGITQVMVDRAYQLARAPGPDTNVVLHVIDAERPKPYRRKNAPTFVIAMAEVPEPPLDNDTLLRVGYPLLVQALANLCVLVSDTPDGLAVRFVTLEQGTYGVGPGFESADVCERAFDRIAPLASSRLVIANDIRTDLPEALWSGDDETRRMLDAGRALDALDLLPSPFPLEEILAPRELRHVKLLYGIGGLSYGNMSARFRGRGVDAVPDPDGPLYWMSASGVDKSDLRNIGEHILLVRGYDAAQDAMVLSVPPDVPVKRVSVDAIEHWMIYREHPDVGAILHVHGWIDGTPSTDVNYPCGTLDLASAVAELVRAAPDPVHAVVGQRNHGLTITGESLDEIFDRVGDRITPRVPME